MRTDIPSTVDREALVRVIRDESSVGLSDFGSEEIADAILSSGVIRDADEVRREADTRRGLALAPYLVERKYAELQAAIQTLCEESEQVRRSSRILPGVEPMVYVSDLRALLADDGADARSEPAGDRDLRAKVMRVLTEASKGPDDSDTRHGWLYGYTEDYATALIDAALVVGPAALCEVKHAVWLEAVQAMAWAMQNGSQENALRYVAEHSPCDYDRRRAEAEDGHLDALMHEEAGDE